MSPRSLTYHYTVSSLSYASQEAKEREQREGFYLNDGRKYGGKTYYRGYSLATAQRRFWRVCREAATDPLAIRVVVRRNTEVWMSVTPEDV